ncbi:hypothetical protein LUZ63_011128 [Rhynchospora breviuscula]|uniref:Major facilitator superfamily (MFS) profile domain-containing protein n=1 Tax=Rhynchospora breviuscula TaxID=2022672 RepID=A0A9Q0CIJ8_9POAL|nr:hypothetical protein LUZ63_011128 [Rhynchospora breviuscula]
MASMTAPLYISEVSPARIRGALVSTNGLLITGGQLLAYLINLAFTKAPGTWRWMLGVATIPAFVQFILMLMLPESPRWLYRKERKEEAATILQKYIQRMRLRKKLRHFEAEIAEEGSIGEGTLFAKLKKALSTRVVRRGLIAGVLCQVPQQFVGINTVMYYSPTIVQLAGFAANSTALALSLITSGLNALGSIVSMYFVDRVGRRLMLMSLIGIIAMLALLGGLFFGAAYHFPAVGIAETKYFTNSTCPNFNTGISWSHGSVLTA